MGNIGTTAYITARITVCRPLVKISQKMAFFTSKMVYFCTAEMGEKIYGSVSEWFKVPFSNSGRGESLSGVRISPLPHLQL